MKRSDIRTLLVLLVLATISIGLNAQVPQVFNYQAVARDNDRNPIPSTALNVKIAILSGNPTGVLLWEETHAVTTSEEGIFTLLVGDPAAVRSAGTLGVFTDIDWQSASMFIRPSIEYQSSWYEMDASPLVAVPYALVAQRAVTGQFPVNGDVVYLPQGSLAIGSDDSGGSKLAVISVDDSSEDALFEVKRADGQTVFAVYPEAVRVYVSRGDAQLKAPGSRGGFSVAGFDRDKATPINDLLWLTPDSVRFYIDDTPTGKAPGSRGGFSVAGFDRDKATAGPQYMSISGSNVPDVIPASSQILFYPLKDAFLAGTIEVEDPDMVGLNSASIGYKNIASGQYSQALGYLSQATADNSMAVGKQAIASGTSSLAIGDNAEASGLRSYAFGYYAKALGTSDVAIGKIATADGSESLAAGFNASANGMNSVSIGAFTTALNQGDNAIGYEAAASGTYSLAVGYQAKANIAAYGATALGFQSVADGYRSTAIGAARTSGSYAVAVGLNSKADGDYSTALGIFCDANSYRSTVIGSWGQANGSANVWLPTDPLFVVGNGVSGYSNAMEILKNGNVGIGAEPVEGYKLYVAGNVLTTGTITPSDKTLKTNVNEILNASSVIESMNGVSFDFRTDEYPDMGLPSGTHFGVIAQEIIEIMPELVRVAADGKMAVAYTEIIPILVEAFKEQQVIIESKEQRLAELEIENAEIQDRLEALEAAVSSMLEK